jgi:hypothetical protein
LSLADCLSRVSSGRTRFDVPIFKLLTAGIPRSIIASPRISILTLDNAGVCMDDEYTTVYRGL